MLVDYRLFSELLLEQKYQNHFISAEIQEMYILANTKCPVSLLNLNLLPFLEQFEKGVLEMLLGCYFL